MKLSMMGPLGVCAVLVLTATAAGAQETSAEPGRIIGRAIAAGAVLAADEFAASGRYEVDDAADSSFRVRQVGGRHRFDRPGRWQPFVGGRVGQVLVDQSIDLGVPVRADSDFDVWGFAVEGGTRIRFGGGWFGEVRGELGYTFSESRLRYPDPDTEALLGPIIDGILFNWKAEAITLEAGVVAGWARRNDRGLGIVVDFEVAGLRTDPVVTDDPIQDVTVDTHFERLAAGLQIPLGMRVFDRPLRLDPKVRHTFLDDELADPLDSNGFTDVRVGLLAEWPRESRWPIAGIGLAVTYTTADAFEGWSVGLTFGP